MGFCWSTRARRLEHCSVLGSACRPVRLPIHQAPTSTHQFFPQVEELRTKHKIDVRVLGVAGLSGMLLSDTDISLENWKDDYKTKVRRNGPAKWLQYWVWHAAEKHQPGRVEGRLLDQGDAGACWPAGWASVDWGAGLCWHGAVQRWLTLLSSACSC